MNPQRNDITCDLLIIGTGMAGMAAALFAARQGIDAVQVGLTGEIGFASGLIDLLGAHPVESGQAVDDPWEGIARLCVDEPRHPYTLVDEETIREAVNAVLAFLTESGYPHSAPERCNQTVMTPVGTLKRTYAIPHTMQHGVAAMAAREACLLVDFAGLKGFSARQIASSLTDRWPQIRPLRIDFPGGGDELYVEHAARAMDVPETRRKLIDAVRPHVGDAATVGFPAILGMYRTLEVMEALQQGLGVPVFEIPTMVPGVTGLRLREIFEQHLPAMGIRSLFQQQVLEAQRLSDGWWQFGVGPAGIEIGIKARTAIMCSGRFFGKGLHAGRTGIRETIFDLPVAQPEDRSSWHHKDLLHPQGHPINRVGISVDGQFRPVDAHGRAVYPNLFAAGSILAHQDWIRQKCGSGLAIATACGAVRSCAQMLA